MKDHSKIVACLGVLLIAVAVAAPVASARTAPVGWATACIGGSCNEVKYDGQVNTQTCGGSGNIVVIYGTANTVTFCEQQNNQTG